MQWGPYICTLKSARIYLFLFFKSTNSVYLRAKSDLKALTKFPETRRVNLTEIQISHTNSLC